MLYKKVADAAIDTMRIVVSLVVIASIAVYLSRHVTCVNIFDKVCFVY